MGRRGNKFGFSSWSWRRASGLSAAKGKLSRSLSVPLTRSGRQRKLGRMAGGIFLAGLLGRMSGGIFLVGLLGGMVLVFALKDPKPVPEPAAQAPPPTATPRPAPVESVSPASVPAMPGPAPASRTAATPKAGDASEHKAEELLRLGKSLIRQEKMPGAMNYLKELAAKYPLTKAGGEGVLLLKRYKAAGY